jgi:hypothetical protein
MRSKISLRPWPALTQKKHAEGDGRRNRCGALVYRSRCRPSAGRKLRQLSMTDLRSLARRLLDYPNRQAMPSQMRADPELAADVVQAYATTTLDPGAKGRGKILAGGKAAKTAPGRSNGCIRPCTIDAL